MSMMQPNRTNSGLVGAVGNLIGGFLSREAEETEQAPRTSARLEAIDKVRAFVERFDVEPSPVTYAFLYQYCVLQEPGLDALLDKLLKNGYLDEADIGQQDQITPDHLENLIGRMGILRPEHHFVEATPANIFGDELGGLLELPEVLFGD